MKQANNDKNKEIEKPVVFVMETTFLCWTSGQKFLDRSLVSSHVVVVYALRALSLADL